MTQSMFQLLVAPPGRGRGARYRRRGDTKRTDTRKNRSGSVQQSSTRRGRTSRTTGESGAAPGVPNIHPPIGWRPGREENVLLPEPSRIRRPFSARPRRTTAMSCGCAFCHLFQPVFTHPPKGGDDPLLRETLTLVAGAHGASPPEPFASAAWPCPVRRYFWCRLLGFSGMVYSIVRSARSWRTTLLS